MVAWPEGEYSFPQPSSEGENRQEQEQLYACDAENLSRKAEGLYFRTARFSERDLSYERGGVDDDASSDSKPPIIIWMGNRPK